MKHRDEIHIVVIEIQQSVVVRGIKNKLAELKDDVTEGRCERGHPLGRKGGSVCAVSVG